MVWPTANFTRCASVFMDSSQLQRNPLYRYHGIPTNIPKNTTSQISYNGCVRLCEPYPHTLPDFYPFVSISQTLTTWVFPAIGIILQAPFETHQAKDTLFALVRWVGNPISSFVYILWNIRTNSKAALMVCVVIYWLVYLLTRRKKVDMSFPADATKPKIDGGQEFGFSSIRDSFYILTNMNQFVMSDVAIQYRQEAEDLLRIALFSKDLPLGDSTGSEKTLIELRRETANVLRRYRKHGVIPVFVSTLIFLIAFALSLQLAFGELGVQEQAHDLALGLFLAWLPVLILATIVDRNFSSTAAVRTKLNKLVNHTCELLRDDGTLEAYCEKFGGPDFKDRISEIRERPNEFKDFFGKFAGQGRVRWHYGAAQPILADVERTFIAEHGRHWMSDPEDASNQLVLSSSDPRGIWYFDPQEIWQIVEGFLIVFLTILGAMGVSYYTPTIGLGCRSGGYMIYLIIAVALLVLEMLAWSAFIWFKERSRQSPQETGRTSERFGETLISIKKWEKYVDGALKFLEFCNSGYLVAFIIAHIIGSFQTCYCLAAMWSTNGGYLDFNNYVSSNLPYLKTSWGVGTAISLFTMLLSMAYITTEWCLQSHLSAENYSSAWAGLGRTRRFRRLLPVRLMRVTVNSFVSCVDSIVGGLTRYLSNTNRRKRLRWEWTVSPQAVADATFPPDESAGRGKEPAVRVDGG